MRQFAAVVESSEEQQYRDPRTSAIIGAAIEVHRHLGPGLLESAYEECLCYELHLRAVAFTRQVPLPVIYKGLALDCGYKIDLIVRDEVVMELKSIEKILPIHASTTSDLPKTDPETRRPAHQLQCPNPHARDRPPSSLTIISRNQGIKFIKPLSPQKRRVTERAKNNRKIRRILCASVVRRISIVCRRKGQSH